MKSTLLLLHGYKQTGDIILNKITKLLGSQFLQKYNKIINPTGIWWDLESPEQFTKQHEYKNYENAIDIISKSIQDVDNITIIAFSQGTVLFEIMYLKNFFVNKEINKVILCSPSGIMDLSIYNLQEQKVKIYFPLLITIGEKEDIFNITPENYQKYSIFDEYELLKHSQGHVIPSQSKDKTIIKNFLN
jgi:hypothetical protein